MGPYIHELPDWPKFHWDRDVLAAPLTAASRKQGRLIGQMEVLGFTIREEAVLRTLTEDVLKTSEIEGEKLDAGQVRSSIARRLGMDIGGLKAADRDVEGVVEMMLDATRPLRPAADRRAAVLVARRVVSHGVERHEQHHRGCVPRRSDSGPMQVVSGPVGRERVHFEAPEAARLPEEMQRFFEWFNADRVMDPVLKAALAHLWFVTIHPFDDGNGRIARAIADMALARSEESPQRFYSMSAQIRQERADYYRILERTQKGTMDITPWMEWFLACLTRAIEGAQVTLSGVIAKARTWEKLRDVPLNERQRLMINRLLDGFEGKLTSSKWAVIAKSSHDTALRDIQQLVDRGVLIKNAAGGRSTSYSLARLEAVSLARAPGAARRGEDEDVRRRRFDQRAQLADFLAESFEVGAALFGVGRDEPRGEEAGEHAEEADAGAHQDAGDEAAFGGDRIVVAVADGRDRRQRPPDRVFGGLDVRAGAVSTWRIEMLASVRSSSARSAAARMPLCRASRAPAPARILVARMPRSTRTIRAIRAALSPPREIQRRNARQQIEPSPRVEIPPPILRAIEADAEIREKHHTHHGIRVGEQLPNLALCWIRRLHTQRHQRIDAQREHEQLIRRRVATNLHRVESSSVTQ